MAMKPGINEAIIEGVLYEKVVREFTEGPNAGSIAGELIIEVPIEIDGVKDMSLIPVSFFTKPLTNAGKPNSAYKGIKTILDNAKSLADVDGDYSQADRIRLRNGNLGENMFFSPDDRFVSFARIRGNFFDRVKEVDCQPKAEFRVHMIVGNAYDEEETVDGEKVETGRYIVVGQIVQYNGTIDEVKFVVQNKKHIDIIKNGWSIGDTVSAKGIIRFTTTQVTSREEEEDGFGDPVVSTQTRRIREFIITGGTQGSIASAYDEEDIAEARRERQIRVNVLKDKQAEKQASPQKSKSAATDW